MSFNTVLISSFHPHISRNILESGVLDKLLSQKIGKVVVLCPDYKYDYFVKNFQSDRVIIHGVKILPLSSLERVWKELGNALLRTSTIRFNRKERYERDGGIIGYGTFLIIWNLIARVSIFSHIYQSLSRRIFDFKAYQGILKQYGPNLVFSTDVFNDDDVRLIASAHSMKIKVVGMVRSWDNCTNKGILPVKPEKIITHNEVILGELVQFHTVSRDLVSVVGIPQFDYYVGYQPARTEYFFEKTKFEKGRKIILFAPTGSKFVDDDFIILQVLIDAIALGSIPGKPQILVRFPPGDTMDISRVKINADVRVYVDHPGVSFSKNALKDREMSNDDMLWLADSLYYSDALISAGSTLCIDMAAFDKPIILPKIQGDWGISPSRSMVKVYDKYHFRYLLRTGGCYLANTPVDLISGVNKSLANKNFLGDGRQRLLNEQTYRFDGKASQRLVDELLSI